MISTRFLYTICFGQFVQTSVRCFYKVMNILSFSINFLCWRFVKSDVIELDFYTFDSQEMRYVCIMHCDVKSIWRKNL